MIRERQPYQRPTRTKRSLAHFASRAHDRAINEYIEAIRLRPTNGDAYSLRVRFRHANGDQDLANADKEAAVRLIASDVLPICHPS